MLIIVVVVEKVLKEHVNLLLVSTGEYPSYLSHFMISVISASRTEHYSSSSSFFLMAPALLKKKKSKWI